MADVCAPITLIGLGRSGTTLIEKAFESSAEVYAGGETGGIIFGTYAGAMDSYFQSVYTDDADRNEFSARVVRRCFESLFPIGSYWHWFHKPAGIPKMIAWERYRTSRDKFEFPTEWYWSVLNTVFVRGRYLTVLRNPWDIVRSRMIFSGWDEKGGWEDIKIMYDIVYRNIENINIIFFDDLVAQPYEEISKLFNKLGLQVPYDLREVVSTKYVPTETGRDTLPLVLEGPDYDIETASLITNLWDRFGKVFNSPNGALFFD
ncbi:sulfotransferase [Pseudomonas oryzihabitans]|uniref:sulfotransferase n=1 Tax=Pseudomonas oryzihabitans TaxID=47885 RepID=UPI002554E28C|nr:sulfotransferase [Pseudomonas oryzihabitans]MDK8262872.1 sulfotransferase [Pseudomonas oryzihabitans]